MVRVALGLQVSVTLALVMRGTSELRTKEGHAQSYDEEYMGVEERREHELAISQRENQA